MRVLVSRGADETVRDMEGKTALDYARENDRLDNIDFLEEIEKAQRCLSNIPYDHVMKHLSSQNVLSELIDRSDISYNELKNQLKEKENLELLLSLGCVSEILKVRSIDDYDKLKEVYQQLSVYVQDPITKKQIRSMFIRRRSVLEK